MQHIVNLSTKDMCAPSKTEGVGESLHYLTKVLLELSISSNNRGTMFVLCYVDENTPKRHRTVGYGDLKNDELVRVNKKDTCCL